MILNEVLIVNGVVAMTGGAGKWLQVVPKTNAEIAAQTVAWGVSEESRTFYNTDTNQLEMWNGTNRVLLG